MNTLKSALEGVEKERDYYFSKLREVEVLCQDQGEESALFVDQLMEVLYASDEQVRDPRLDSRTVRGRFNVPDREKDCAAAITSRTCDCHFPLVVKSCGTYCALERDPLLRSRSLCVITCVCLAARAAIGFKEKRKQA